MKNLKEIAQSFDIKGEVLEIKPLGDGLINDTYIVVTSDDAPNYVLQRINHNVFKDVEGMQRNIAIVTQHIKRKLIDSGVNDIERRVLDFLPLKEPTAGDQRAAGEEHISGTVPVSTYLYRDGSYWRLSRYIRDSVTLSEVTPATAYEAGKAFGNFQLMLEDIDADLTESIPDFHNMEFRLQQLQDAIESDPVGRVGEVGELLEKVSARADRYTAQERLYRNGKLPKRVCHCDTKVNNILFDKSGEVLCVIDLDTVMPSFVSSDFGDFLRTGACTTAEDEPDLTKIGFKMDIFKSFAEGYLSEAGQFLTAEELNLLVESVALFPYMQGVRFLTDYINGDTYYKTTHPEHNLERAKAQFRMMEVVESKMPEINAFILSIS